MTETPTALRSLTELQAMNLPPANWREFLKAEGLTPDEEAALDAYFVHFLPPGPCVKCGSQQGGDVLASFLGTAKFRWGIAHGEGFCSAKGCGYPARAYHYDVGPIKRLTLILQIHPSELSEPSAHKGDGKESR